MCLYVYVFTGVCVYLAGGLSSGFVLLCVCGIERQSYRDARPTGIMKDSGLTDDLGQIKRFSVFLL